MFKFKGKKLNWDTIHGGSFKCSVLKGLDQKTLYSVHSAESYPSVFLSFVGLWLVQWQQFRGSGQAALSGISFRLTLTNLIEAKQILLLFCGHNPFIVCLLLNIAGVYFWEL